LHLRSFGFLLVIAYKCRIEKEEEEEEEVQAVAKEAAVEGEENTTRTNTAAGEAEEVKDAVAVMMPREKQMAVDPTPIY
jgi:hypothetical protein